jgi:hypothetical protein
MMSGTEESFVSLQRFAKCFLLTRVLEAAWLVLALSAALVLEHASDSAATDKWKYWTVPATGYASFVALVWYYVGFGYILVSAVVHFVVRRAWIGSSAIRYAVLNVGTFCAHSLLVIVLVFHGELTSALWAAWLAMALYNAVVPMFLWNWVILRRLRAA